uniref:Uncharacterized protein n=1 Tax=Meloidogyne enterolobii TaxID=390850 RepID=A0A6V7TWW8_MELEN|nr:unnamed protein product [Meloidogyne enterolobii]
MDKSFSYPSLFPNNKTTTTTNPPHFLVDQDHLDKLSNQLKLLKIDDSTINKILKKFKTVKKEVKLEPIDCQVFEAQQQPFVGYNGLFELAISQVIQCGYGHVLPLIGTKKENNSKKMSKRNNKNISLKEKIILKNAEFLNKIASKKNHSFDNEQISKFVDNHNKCIKKYLILDEKNDQIMEGEKIINI